ncbi:V-type ATP synthase subunit E [Archaeoglobales archaeon]|nr:MAG: V-type ATP synthase subunit E [Archaeoglobales archaeon]
MPLEKVLQEIQQKGEEEVNRIKMETEKEVERIISQAKLEAEEILKKARGEAEREAEAIKRQEISSVNLEMKRAILNKQKEVLEEVFEILKQRVEGMDEETKKKLVKSLISKNAAPGMLIYSKKEDEELVKSVIEELNVDLKYAGNIKCLGGVILEDPTGKIRINLTFDELLNQVYEQKMSEVSKILFG